MLMALCCMDVLAKASGGGGGSSGGKGKGTTSSAAGTTSRIADSNGYQGSRPLAPDENAAHRVFLHARFAIYFTLLGVAMVSMIVRFYFNSSTVEKRKDLEEDIKSKN